MLNALNNLPDEVVAVIGLLCLFVFCIATAFIALYWIDRW